MSDHVSWRGRTAARIAFAAVVLGALLATVPPGATPAWAASSVSVQNEFGQAQADLNSTTSVTVRGTGFQSIQGGFGGVYVFFGWVDDPSGGSWKPSNGGLTGQDFNYVPDVEARDNQGFQRFVTFPGGSTSSAAQAELSADGSWTVDMRIPGPVFEAVDRSGNVTSIDCLSMGCGIITIGAHGVVNANNETFTPVQFTDLYTSASGQGTGGSAAGAAQDAVAGADSAALPPAIRTVGYDSATAIAGRVLTFTGQGFIPGELVVATLDDGVASVGPLQAGALGEVAGLLKLPGDLDSGTHTLTLTSAASDTEIVTEVLIGASADRDVEAAAVPEQDALWPYLVLGAAILILLGLLAFAVVRGLRARASARRSEALA